MDDEVNVSFRRDTLLRCVGHVVSDCELEIRPATLDASVVQTRFELEEASTSG